VRSRAGKPWPTSRSSGSLPSFSILALISSRLPPKLAARMYFFILSRSSSASALSTDLVRVQHRVHLLGGLRSRLLLRALAFLLALVPVRLHLQVQLQFALRCLFLRFWRHSLARRSRCWWRRGCYPSLAALVARTPGLVAAEWIPELAGLVFR
jgi:hypothetical protein